jgi:predicted dehydrogenase
MALTLEANNRKGLYEFDANVVAVMKLADGTIAKSSSLLDAELPYALNIDLLGTEGALRDNRIWSRKVLPGQTTWTVMPTVMPDSGDVGHHPFDAQINHFVVCIREDRESHCNVADAYRTHELCLAIDRSAAQGGSPVKLPLE